MKDEGKKWAKGKYPSTSAGLMRRLLRRINAEIPNHRGNSTVPCFQHNKGKRMKRRREEAFFWRIRWSKSTSSEKFSVYNPFLIGIVNNTKRTTLTILRLHKTRRALDYLHSHLPLHRSEYLQHNGYSWNLAFLGQNKIWWWMIFGDSTTSF